MKMFLSILAPFFLILWVSCGKPPSGGGGPPEGDFPVNVVGAPVKVTPIQDTVRLVGTVFAVDAVDLKSQRLGEVTHILKDQGESVEAGELLYRLDDESLRAQRDEAQARLRLAEQNLERITRLRESNSSTEQEMDAAVAARAEAQARLVFVETELKNTNVTAPFSGRLGERRVNIGEIVQPGTMLTRLVRMSPLEIRFEVPERYLGALVEGLSVEVSSEAFPGDSVEAEVVFVGPEVSLTTRTVPVRAVMEEDTGGLRPGMFVRVHLVLAERPEALVIPEAAVMQRGTQTMVMRQNEEGRAEIVPVQVGVREGGRMEILEGLNAGDRVVVEGLMKARPGMLLNFGPESERYGLTVEAEE